MTEASQPSSVTNQVSRSEEELADFSAARTLRPHIARSVVLLTIAFVFLIFWAIGLTSSLLGALSTVGLQAMVLPPDIASFLALVGIGGFLIFLLVWMASLFAPVKEAVAESNVLLEQAADRATPIFDSITTTIEARCPPFVTEVERAADHPSLLVSNGREWGVVLVRTIGPDLHVSWTMWRNRSTMALVRTTLSDMFDSARSDDPGLRRASSCSALRQLIEAATQRAIA